MRVGWLISLLLAASVASAADTVVVCPDEFRTTLTPWLDHRVAQGHAIEIVSNLGEPEEIRARIRGVAQSGELRFIVLVGDAEPALIGDPVVRARCVPAVFAEAKVNILWGSEREIATDNWYADFDDDQLPDAAIGRLPADSSAELAAMIEKIVAYESRPDFGRWRQRVNFVAGLGGFGQLADAAIEGAARKLISEGIPACYATTMTHGSWRSPYCPDPREFHHTALARLNEGCLAWVYMGHGARHELDRVHVPSGDYHILGTEDMPKLNGPNAPLAFFLACYTGAFDARRDCLAEELFRAPCGPVAVVSGSRVTMPYGMSSMGVELLQECFVRRTPTIGEALLAAKRNMVLRPRTGETASMLDAVATLLTPGSPDLAAERMEHVLLFNLIGDPAMRIRQPDQVEVVAGATVAAGGDLVVTGSSPLAGKATIELVVRRDRLTFQHEPRREFDRRDLTGYRDVYERANDPRLAVIELDLSAGPFEVRLHVPSDAEGPCHVRVFVEGETDFALGAADVEVAPPAGR